MKIKNKLIQPYYKIFINDFNTIGYIFWNMEYQVILNISDTIEKSARQKKAR